MFPSEEFWLSAMGAVIGGIFTVVLLKLWEKKGGAAEENSPKRATENDERF